MAEKNFRVKKGLTVDGTGDSSIAGNLGIGITTPSEALHIRSSSDHPIVLENDQNAEYVGIQFSDHANGSYGQKGELRFNHADSSSQGSGASFHFTTTETELSIVGGKFISAVGTASKPGFAFGGGDFDNGMFHPATNEIAFSTAGAEAVRIDASGNVGIGDTTPSSPLTIYHAVTNPALDGIGGNAFAMNIDIDLSGSGATGGDREQGGIYIDLDTSATGGDTSDEHRPYGIWVDARQKSAADADALYGVYAYTESERSSASTSNTTNQVGVYGYATSDETADNTVSALMGVYGAFSIQDAGVVSNAFGLRAHSSVHNNRSTNTGALHGCAAEIDISGTRDGNSGRSNANITTGDARVFESTFDHNVASSGEGTVSVTNSYLYYGNSSITDSAQVTNNYGVYMNGETKNYFSGKVGIGITSPSHALHVRGSGAQKIKVESTDNEAAIELASDSSGPWVMYSANGSDDLRWYGNSAVRMALTSAGRLGIGTSSPSVPLHVVSSGTTSLLLESTDAGAADAPILELYRNSDSPANGNDLGQILWSQDKADGSKTSVTKMYAEINTVDNSDRLMINVSSSGGSGMNDYEYIRLDGGVRDIIFNETGQDIDVRMEGSSVSGLFFLDASSDRIGIGTTSPEAELHVEGSLAVAYALAHAGQTGQNRLIFGTNTQAFQTAGTDRLTIAANGNVTVAGAFSAATKSFDIEHPREEGKRLHHGSLEGPEHGVYIRGHQVGDTIELPDYWLGLVDEDTITVQLTAKGRSQNLYVKSVDREKVVVGGFITKSPDFYYFIQAERKDVEKMVVEY